MPNQFLVGTPRKGGSLPGRWATHVPTPNMLRVASFGSIQQTRRAILLIRATLRHAVRMPVVQDCTPLVAAFCSSTIRRHTLIVRCGARLATKQRLHLVTHRRRPHCRQSRNCVSARQAAVYLLLLPCLGPQRAEALCRLALLLLAAPLLQPL